MAATYFKLDKEDVNTARTYWNAERELMGIDEECHPRLYGVMGEMIAHWYLEERYDDAGVVPFGLLTRAGVCNRNGFNAGDLVMVRGNTVSRFEVKTTTTPENRWRIKEKDAANYARAGIDHVLFVHLNPFREWAEGEVYGRISPGEILCLWDRQWDDESQQFFLLHPAPPALSLNCLRFIAERNKTA